MDYSLLILAGLLLTIVLLLTILVVKMHLMLVALRNQSRHLLNDNNTFQATHRQILELLRELQTGNARSNNLIYTMLKNQFPPPDTEPPPEVQYKQEDILRHEKKIMSAHHFTTDMLQK